MGFGECHVAPVWFQYYEKRYQLIRQNATLNPNPNPVSYTHLTLPTKA